MRAGGSSLRGRAKADHRLAGDHHRLVGCLRGGECRGDLRRVMAIAARHGPATGGKARELIRRVRHRQLAVDRDAVVVPQHDQVLELEVASERDRLLADALHQAAVARQHIGLVVDECVAERSVEVALRNGEAHGIGDALPQGPRRRLDAGGMAEFRVARGLGAELAEVLDVVEAHVRIAREIEQRIHQHGAVPGRQDEAVAVRPVRVCGVEFQELREQNRCHVCGPHGQARMAGIGLLHRVHAEGADRIRHGARLFGGMKGHARRFLGSETRELGLLIAACAVESIGTRGCSPRSGRPFRGRCAGDRFSLLCVAVKAGRFCNLTRGFDGKH